MTSRSALRTIASRLRASAAGLALGVLVLEPGQGACATSLKDIQVGIRGVEFLTQPPRGQVPVAIIADGRSKVSQQDAAAIMGWLVSVGHGAKVELIPEVVDIADLASAQPYRVAIVASGLEASFARIGDYARAHGTLTITADLNCVRLGNCVLGVSTEPGVEVLLSRQASQAAGVEFVRAFRMMVKEY